jgi:hypothetical protein
LLLSRATPVTAKFRTKLLRRLLTVLGFGAGLLFVAANSNAEGFASLFFFCFTFGLIYRLLGGDPK